MDICKLRGEPCGHLGVLLARENGEGARLGIWDFLQANSIDKYPVEVPIDK